MPISKINAFTHKVADLADVPQMSPAEFKAKFDEAPEELRQKVNSIVDVLQSVVDGDSGGDNIAVTAIAGLTGTTVQEVVESLKALDDENRAYLLGQIQGVVLGQVPDGSVTPLKISSEIANMYRSVKDSNDLFTTLEWNRPSGTKFKRSVLSGGTSPKYTTRTVTYYAENGTTVIASKVYTLAYTGDDLTSEVLQ